MESYNSTISAELDRLEVKAGKIGMNSREQAYALLCGLDEVYCRIQDLSNEQSRKVLEAEFGGIVARMEREAGLMLRDLGGRAALAEARAKAQPPKEHTWWYLDEHLSGSRQDSLRRGLIMGGIILVVLVVLGVVYQAFLAPDPQVAARYSLEQNTRDLMMSGEYEAALEQVDQGLVIAPSDPALSTLKGVVLDLLGQEDQAQASYGAAARLFEKPEAFYVTRGQAFATANRPEQALADAQEAIRLNPDLAEAYLLSGQANEMLGKFQDALAAYELAYSAADASEQLELAAMARMRTAMLMQSLGGPAMPGAFEATETP